MRVSGRGTGRASAGRLMPSRSARDAVSRERLMPSRTARVLRSWTKVGRPFRRAGRRTNLALLVALIGSFVTGWLAFGIGAPMPAAFTSVTHGVLGLALVVLIPWKNVVVGRAPRKAILSLILLGVIVLCVIAGIVAVLGGFRTYAGLTPMQFHVGAALIAVPTYLGDICCRRLDSRPAPGRRTSSSKEPDGSPAHRLQTDARPDPTNSTPRRCRSRAGSSTTYPPLTPPSTGSWSTGSRSPELSLLNSRQRARSKPPWTVRTAGMQQRPGAGTSGRCPRPNPGSRRAEHPSHQHDRVRTYLPGRRRRSALAGY